MNKLEKSIRHEMKFYGPDLRNGKYWVSGDTGALPNGFRGFFSAAFCDYDAVAGIVTDIRLYVYGDASNWKDYHGQSINISAAITGYLHNDEDRGWDGLIQDIVDIVKEMNSENKQEEA